MASRSEESTDWRVKCPEMWLRTLHLLNSRQWADCSFQFPIGTGAGRSNILYAHKLILATTSPVFAAMFYGNVGAKEVPIIISDIDHSTFTALLKYIYTDRVLFPDVKAAISLYKAANKYIVVHLEKKCIDFLFKALENPNNVCRIYEFACFFGKKILEEKCLEQFSNKTQLILKSSNFRFADSNTLKKIISLDTLDINSEVDLFNALLEYANNQKFNKSDDSGNFEPESIDLSELSKAKVDHEADNNNIAKSSEINVSLSSTEKPEEARCILKGIIEGIRFLSMPPKELAKIGESTTVLSKEEMGALYVNMFSPNSSMPLPSGFSCKREPRIRGAATISLTLHNVTSMNIDQPMYYPLCYVRKLPWNINTKRDRVDSQEFLRLYLACDEGSTVSQEWSFNTKVEMRLLSFSPFTAPILRKFETTFSTKHNAWGQNFVEWSKLIDPDNNYIKDDSITVEVHFVTVPVQGIDLK